MSKRLTFAKLKRFLVKLGFTEITTHPDQHAIVFKNGTQDSLIVLPLLSPRSLVSQMHQAAVRRILLQHNLVDQDQWSQLVNA
jgi:hypothetical protein